MKNNLLKPLVSIFLATTLLASCGGTDTSTTEGTGDTSTTTETASKAYEPKELFVMGIEGDPTNNINPLTASGRYDLTASKIMYNPLYTYKSDDEIIYYLATDISASEDLLTYTVKLREDVKWHDGVDFTADDVVFSFERFISDQNTNGYDSFQFDGNPLKVNKIDDYTVEFVLPYAIPNALELLAVEHFIAPKHIYEGEADLTTSTKNATPIGTGPYKFVSYKEGDNLTFVKNEDYFLGEPEIDNLVLKFLTDPNSALVALQNGEIDSYPIQPNDVAKLESSDITVYPYTEGRINYMTTFVYRPNFDNEDYRKAVFYALDKQSLNQAVYLSEDNSRIAYSFLPQTSTYFSEDVEKYEYNLDKSKEYLAKSGVTNPTVKIAYSANSKIYETQATLAQANLNAAGFKCEIVAVDATVMSKAMLEKTVEYDLTFSGYIMGIDPTNYATLFTSDGAYNYSGIKSDVLDQAFINGAKETDPAKREVIFTQLQKDFMDLAFFYPIAENKRLVAVNNRISGIEDAGLVSIFTFEDFSKLVEVTE